MRLPQFRICRSTLVAFAALSVSLAVPFGASAQGGLCVLVDAYCVGGPSTPPPPSPCNDTQTRTGQCTDPVTGVVSTQTSSRAQTIGSRGACIWGAWSPWQPSGRLSGCVPDPCTRTQAQTRTCTNDSDIEQTRERTRTVIGGSCRWQLWSDWAPPCLTCLAPPPETRDCPVSGGVAQTRTRTATLVADACNLSEWSDWAPDPCSSTCPDGTVVGPDDDCPDAACPDGTTVANGEACPPLSCPDGTTVPNGQVCPCPASETRTRDCPLFDPSEHQQTSTRSSLRVDGVCRWGEWSQWAPPCPAAPVCAPGEVGTPPNCELPPCPDVVETTLCPAVAGAAPVEQTRSSPARRVGGACQATGDWSDWMPECPAPDVDCPDGTAVPHGESCPDVQCPDGTTVPNGAACPPVTCPDGTTLPNGAACPPVSCPDGTTVPNGETCPPVQCPDGTTVPNGEECTPVGPRETTLGCGNFHFGAGLGIPNLPGFEIVIPIDIGFSVRSAPAVPAASKAVRDIDLGGVVGNSERTVVFDCDLSWAPVAGAEGYELQVRTDPLPTCVDDPWGTYPHYCSYGVWSRSNWIGGFPDIGRLGPAISLKSVPLWGTSGYGAHRVFLYRVRAYGPDWVGPWSLVAGPRGCGDYSAVCRSAGFSDSECRVRLRKAGC